LFIGETLGGIDCSRLRRKEEKLKGEGKAGYI
jgi:hypothetical protein